MEKTIPEKARFLKKLKEAGFNVPDLIYVSAEDITGENFNDLNTFLENHRESYKVIARSAHPREEFFKGGTFDSLETYADLNGIKYARKRIVNSFKTNNRLSILRQQLFNNAPQIDPDEMGVMVMPFIDGMPVMAKMIRDYWEFGYSRDRIHKVQSEPYITKTPHDTKLLDISEAVQDHLGFKCEIEYIISEDGTIYIVQAKDISRIEILEEKESNLSVRLNRIRRIRKRKNYRERPIFVMDNRQFYIRIVSKCEDLMNGSNGSKTGLENILNVIEAYEKELELFALQHERYAVLGFQVQVPPPLYQVVNHYLDDTPELQKILSKALSANIYMIDYFLAEADTLLASNKIKLKMCTHDAYGIDTIRNPIWHVEWNTDRHDEVVKKFKKLGFMTGDTVGIEIDSSETPIVHRL